MFGLFWWINTPAPPPEDDQLGWMLEHVAIVEEPDEVVSY